MLLSRNRKVVVFDVFVGDMLCDFFGREFVLAFEIVQTIDGLHHQQFAFCIVIQEFFDWVGDLRLVHNSLTALLEVLAKWLQFIS